MNTNFSYDKMDYYSILEYLKKQAEYFSDGDWTDFSDADIGTVLLKLMAMNADTTNFQIEKGVSELYLDTAIERVNAIALCKLVGYEPKHYQSALIDLTANYVGEAEDDLKIPAFSSFSDSTGNIKFYTLEDTPINPGINTIRAYQGDYVYKQYDYSDIDENGRILLDDYNIGVNTLVLSQAGLRYKRVDNALYGEGEGCFSIHINLDNKLYIQLPTYYSTIMSNTTPIDVVYLLSKGVEGRVGSGVITGTMNLSNGINIAYTNQNPSEGGYNPETVEDIRKEAPAYASTMNTLVTLNDFRILSKDFSGIADAVALDYNYPESGLVQPTQGGSVNDAYKVNLYILPENADSIYKVIEDDGTSEMVHLADTDFNITGSTTSYEFEYVADDGYFSNNNSFVSNSSCNITLNTKLDWNEIYINWEIDTEESYDIFYIDVGGNNLVTASGNRRGQLVLNGITTETPIVLNYIKDSSGNSATDKIKVYLYGNNSNPDPVYTDELLDEVKVYLDDIKKKKPAGIEVNHMDVNYLRPHLVIRAYMDKDDLRYETAGLSIAEYLEKLYSRENHKIGEPIYQSHISKDILSKFDYIRYLEVLSLEGAENGAIKPDNTQYVELLATNMTVKVIPYES